MKAVIHGLLLCVLSLSSSVSATADPLQPPDLPNQVTGARVYSAGAILKNASSTPAEDVRIGFRIPSFWGGENINQLSLIFGVGGITQVVQQGNQFSSNFDEHFILEGFTIPPNGTLELSGLVESKKKNALKWNRDAMKLTGPNQEELPTLFYNGKIEVKENSPLSYTFGNDSNVSLFVEQIALGVSDTLMDVEAGYSLGLLGDLTIFNNGGTGWMLAQDAEVSLTLPFELPTGDLLVADIVGVGDPGGSDELPIHFIQQHEDDRLLPSTGCCATPTAVVPDVTPEECEGSLGGTFLGYGTDCAGFPTLSQWALLGLALLLLATGALVLYRRQRLVRV